MQQQLPLSEGDFEAEISTHATDQPTLARLAYQNRVLATLQQQNGGVQLPTMGGELLDEKGYIRYSVRLMSKKMDATFGIADAPHPFLNGILQTTKGYSEA